MQAARYASIRARPSSVRRCARVASAEARLCSARTASQRSRVCGERCPGRASSGSAWSSTRRSHAGPEASDGGKCRCRSTRAACIRAEAVRMAGCGSLGVSLTTGGLPPTRSDCVIAFPVFLQCLRPCGTETIANPELAINSRNADRFRHMQPRCLIKCSSHSISQARSPWLARSRPSRSASSLTRIGRNKATTRAMA